MKTIKIAAVHVIKMATGIAPGSAVVALCGVEFDDGCVACSAGDKPVSLTLWNAKLLDGDVVPAGAYR